MKILQINPIAGHSSTGRTTSELDNYFWENGHEDYVACFSGYNVRDKYLIGNIIDRKCHALLSRLTGFEACYSFFPTINLIKYIKKLKPDIVKIGIAHSNYINIFKLLNFLGKENIPTVLVLNDCWYYTGKCMHYTINQCYKWKSGCGNCNHLENGLKTYFFDRTEILLKMKKSSILSIPRLAVVGVSDWLVNEARQSFLSNAKILKRIYNWVDLNKFYPNKIPPKSLDTYHLNNKKIILGVASKWIPSKGIDLFIRLANEVDNNTFVVLVGKIHKEIILPSQVIHVPETYDIDELAKLYSRADVFVTFSKEETFGKVSAEALACGTPVVCYNSTASPEIVGKGCGKVVPVGDYVAAKMAIEEILNKGKNEYSEVCIQHAKNNFCFQNNAQEYLSLFKKLINIAK